MSKLITIAQALRDSGLTVTLDARNKEVSVSGSDYLISIAEYSGEFQAMLFAGNDTSCNAWAYEEELFSYRNPMAVIGAVSRRVEQLNNFGD
jgi:hypothetical protein